MLIAVPSIPQIIWEMELREHENWSFVGLYLSHSPIGYHIDWRVDPSVRSGRRNTCIKFAFLQFFRLGWTGAGDYRRVAGL